MTRQRTAWMAAGLAAATIAGAGGAIAQDASAAAEASWIHVRVDEADGAKVNLNLPLSLVEVALEAAGPDLLDREELRFHRHGDVTLAELRAMWRALGDAGDADLLDVQDGEERVRVFQRGETVHVLVEEEDAPKVRVELPASIVDALLGGEGEELDLAAAARALARSGSQEVVRIDDDETTVRIWVDSSRHGG